MQPAEPAGVEEHRQIDVVRLLVVVLRHELLRADAEGMLEDEAGRLLLAAEAAFGALVVALVECRPLLEQAGDLVELAGRPGRRPRYAAAAPSPSARRTSAARGCDAR